MGWGNHESTPQFIGFQQSTALSSLRHHAVRVAKRSSKASATYSNDNVLSPSIPNHQTITSHQQNVTNIFEITNVLRFGLLTFRNRWMHPQYSLFSSFSMAYKWLEMLNNLRCGDFVWSHLQNKTNKTNKTNLNFVNTTSNTTAQLHRRLRSRTQSPDSFILFSQYLFYHYFHIRWSCTTMVVAPPQSHF